MDNHTETSGFDRPPAATYRNQHKSTDVEFEVNASLGKPQRRPETYNESQGFVAQLLKGLASILGIRKITLAWFLPMLLLCFFLYNIFRTAIDSMCNFPAASYIIPSCQSSREGNERFNALENFQSRLVHVQEIGASGITLPM